MHFDKFRGDEDFVQRAFDNSYFTCRLCYLTSVCNEQDIFNKLVSCFYRSESAEQYELYLQSFAHWSLPATEAEAIDKMLAGHVIVSIGGTTVALAMPNFVARSTSVSTEENVLQGPKDGLSENVEASLNLIRNRYKQAALRAETRMTGSKSAIKMIMLYDEQLTDPAVLAAFNERLAQTRVGVLQSAGQLQKHLVRNKYNLFPLFLATERPDRIVKNLAEGRVVILLEGSSWALIGPATFFDFFKSMDDPVQLPVIGVFFVALRYLALIITLVLPSLYIAIISYAPDLLKIQFALLVAGSRMTVPFPSYIEMLFMLIMTEFLIEASIRLPKTISPAATTVGGLILGQAATQAGLVAGIMIIVISVVAISNFVVPVNAMHQAIRVMRYPLVILASVLGTIGVVVGLLALIAYLCSLRSLGRPYMKLV